MMLGQLNDPRLSGRTYNQGEVDPENGQDLLTMLSGFHSNEEMNRWLIPQQVPSILPANSFSPQPNGGGGMGGGPGNGAF
jgi:hypothetical protein